MEFQLSYFKSKKMMLWKCCTQYASKFGKLSTGHRTGKCQFSFQSQRKAMPVKVAQFSSVSSVAQSCPTLCDPMNCSKPGLPVHHQLPEFTKTHIHRVSDAIQPSHPLSSPSPPAPNPSQHQSLFQGVNSLHEVAKYWSFSFSVIPSKEHPGLISFRMDWLQSEGLSRVFSNTTVQKHQLFGAQLSLYCNSHIHTWLLEKP